MRLEKLAMPRQLCVVKGHMAMLLLQVEKHIGIQAYVIRLLEQLNKLTKDENKLPIMRIIADALDPLFVKKDIFELGQYIFIGMCGVKGDQRWIWFSMLSFLEPIRIVAGWLFGIVLARRTGKVFAIHQQSAFANKQRGIAATVRRTIFEIGAIDFQIRFAVCEANL